jgi:two-component system LytT family sensor kinase
VVPSFLIRAALVQRDPSVWSREEIVSAASGLSTGLLVAILVFWLVPRAPWPRPFRLRFLALHAVAAPLAASAWLVAASVIQWLVLGGSLAERMVDRAEETLFIGIIFYTIVAGISYAVASTARAARAEALAARTQLAALRAQLQPHFLFNALHTVVQLIPIEPARAMEAAELVAELLRTTLEEQRDEVTLADEWRFVSRYLAVERIRFGDRLVVRAELPEGLLDAWVPAYALQTLVENAVRHGAAPRVAATEIVVTATASARELTLTVRNTGDAVPAPAVSAGSGTGLARLHERLAVLHGGAARLASGPREGGGYEAVLVLPRHRARAAA